MDFQFLQDPVAKKWVTLSPKREKRPDEAQGDVDICPFCPGREKEQPSVYEVSEDPSTSPWLVRVISNKYPFAPIHEVIIHSPDHHKSFGELSDDQVTRIMQTYRERYNTHRNKGQVVIFNNSGQGSGESLPHPHSQLAVIPTGVSLDIVEYEIPQEMLLDAGKFLVGTPAAAQWPDEVWVVPKETGNTFGDISDEEIASLADAINRLVKIYSHKYGHEFPFNFYIRPGMDWYVRFVPRAKVLGGFEIGTGMFVNTHDPKETIAFLKKHWEDPDCEKK